jgi:hypothetical protein
MKEATCRTDLGPLTKKLLEQQQLIERLTAERDEARREICENVAMFESVNAKQLAQERGWDCFGGNAP